MKFASAEGHHLLVHGSQATEVVVCNNGKNGVLADHTRYSRGHAKEISDRHIP